MEKVGLSNDQIANEGGSSFIAWGILTKPAFVDFTIGLFDKRKGGISVYDYCSYNR
jgi:hypothetical protein